MPLPASVIGSGRDCGLLEGCWANTVAGVIGAIESEDPRCIGRFSVYGDSFRHPGPRDTAHTTHRALPVAVLVACLLLTLRIVHRRPRLPAHAAIDTRPPRDRTGSAVAARRLRNARGTERAAGAAARPRAARRSAPREASRLTCPGPLPVRRYPGKRSNAVSVRPGRPRCADDPDREGAACSSIEAI